MRRSGTATHTRRHRPTTEPSRLRKEIRHSFVVHLSTWDWAATILRLGNSQIPSQLGCVLNQDRCAEEAS